MEKNEKCKMKAYLIKQLLQKSILCELHKQEKSKKKTKQRVKDK